MTRRHLTFACEGETLVGTVDEGTATLGLLIVSGGSEIRAGAFNSQSRIAARIAAEGYPVFRYDRRGIGDSTGDSLGFRQTGSDIAAAIAAFHAAAPHLTHVVAFGNCDAASALMLNSGASAQAMLLSNPWTYEDEESEAPPPPDAIRARYAAKLKDPREVLRLLRGEVNLRKLFGGLLAASKAPPPPSGLVEQMRGGLEAFVGKTRILLADRDRTAQAFTASWAKDDPRLIHRAGADHAFSGEEDQQWLVDQILAALHEQAG